MFLFFIFTCNAVFAQHILNFTNHFADVIYGSPHYLLEIDNDMAIITEFDRFGRIICEKFSNKILRYEWAQNAININIYDHNGKITKELELKYIQNDKNLFIDALSAYGYKLNITYNDNG